MVYKVRRVELDNSGNIVKERKRLETYVCEAEYCTAKGAMTEKSQMNCDAAGRRCADGGRKTDCRAGIRRGSLKIRRRTDDEMSVHKGLRHAICRLQAHLRRVPGL